jgi:hypothetical protein
MIMFKRLSHSEAIKLLEKCVEELREYVTEVDRCAGSLHEAEGELIGETEDLTPDDGRDALDDFTGCLDEIICRYEYELVKNQIAIMHLQDNVK